MVLRTFIIAIGLIFEIFVVVIGFIFLAVWILMPLASFYLFYLGIKLFFY